MGRLTPEIREMIDQAIKSQQPFSYQKLSRIIAQKFGIAVSKAAISRHAKALKLQFPRGRKRAYPPEKGPAYSRFLDCAGAFFLKGAELELGLQEVITKLLATSSDSRQAQKTWELAQQINALLLYAPVFELNSAQEIADCEQKGLLYLSEQKDLPSIGEIEQYLRFLSENKLLFLIIKEVVKRCAEALAVRIDFAQQTFYLDAQTRTVWPNPEIPRYFSASLNKVMGYIKKVFQVPSVQQPLILQTCPGYTFLPKEMFNLIQCFSAVAEQPISRIMLTGKSGETLALWQEIKPAQKYYFIAALSPWQYARLEGTQIVQDFKQYLIGPAKEPIAVAEAKVNLLNPQLNINIKVRAALVRRGEERLALITNISPRDERYIRKIAEQYFCRWPDSQSKTYYDLLEEAHQEVLARSASQSHLTPLYTIGYSQKPEDGFKLLLTHLHQYALDHFFPSEYAAFDLKMMCETFYRQSGYLKIKQNSWEIILRPFAQKKLNKDAQEASRRFNQSAIEFADQKRLCISVLANK